jgi:ribosome-associated protein
MPASRAGETQTIDGLDIARRAREALEAKKGEHIALLDVRGLSSVTDYFLIVSASSPPHLKALANEVQRVLKESGVHCYRRSGTPATGWMVLDYFDAIIHIFAEETRVYYGIEDLWGRAPRLD